MGILRLFPWDRLPPPSSPKAPQSWWQTKASEFSSLQILFMPLKQAMAQTLSLSGLIGGQGPLILGLLCTLDPKPFRAMQVFVTMLLPQCLMRT